MRDRRADHHPGHRGLLSAGEGAPTAAVAGGGIAGLTAAVALAERGVRVHLLEAQPFLGGRLAGWPVELADGSTATMSRGFHAFFRQYYNLRSLLRRVDPDLGMLTGLPDYPLWREGGARDSFRRVPRTPPWSALGFVALSPTFSWRDALSINVRTALPLLDVRVPDVYDTLDGISAEQYLRDVRFPTQAMHLAFEVFSRSFFADPAELSAAELALMFHIYFLGSSEGLLFDVPNRPFPQALWDPLAGYLSGLGARIRTGTAVHEVEPRGRGFDLVTDEERLHVDALVLATDVRGLQRISAASTRMLDSEWRERIAGLRSAPPFLVSRLWLDRAAAADRPAFLGTSGYDGLDNVSILDRWEDEAAAWAARTGGSVVELHAYAIPPGTPHTVVQDRLLAQLGRVYPELRQAKALDAHHEWRQDCPMFPVDGYRDRPTVLTGHPHLVLAGDLVRSSLPCALMERAATTGFEAANALLARWGLQGHPLGSVPNRGRWAALRRAARRP